MFAFGSKKPKKSKFKSAKSLNAKIRKSKMADPKNDDNAEKPTVIPQAIGEITTIIHNINKLKHELFAPAPSFMKDMLDEAVHTLAVLVDALNQKLKKRILENKEPEKQELVQTVSKIYEDLMDKDEILAREAENILNEIETDNSYLTPELIKANLDTIKLLSNKCEVVANDQEIFIETTGTAFTIDIDGETFECPIDYKARIPVSAMKLVKPIEVDEED